MNNEHLFQFAILRYIHDVARGEFLNVGVVVYSKESQYVKGRFITDCSRLSNVFSVNEGHLLRTIRHINNTIDSENATYWTKEYQCIRIKDFLSFRVLPRDDSSLQFDGFGGGITDDLDGELDRLYNRIVGEYNYG